MMGGIHGAQSAMPAASSMPLPTTFSVARLAAALAAWERNAREAARWAHPSWWAPALDVPPPAVFASFDALREALASAHNGTISICSLALLRALQVAMPDFNSLRAPDPKVLDALPVDDGLRVLRMRALLLRRTEVRRLIDKQSRRRIAQWVGVPLERLTLAMGHAMDQPVPANVRSPVIELGHRPALDTIDEERLAYEGYALIAHDMQGESDSAIPVGRQVRARLDEEGTPRPCPLLRLALPRDVPPPWFNPSVRELDASGTALLFAQLPELLPEWGWLFG
ncbi:type III secretion protein (plasmid) [Cupriavidus necator]|nr:type III secretion protein [Cupriavidus necator]